jgi:hypothetical protein
MVGRSIVFVLLMGVGMFILGSFTGERLLSFQFTDDKRLEEVEVTNQSGEESESSEHKATAGVEGEEELLRPEDISAIKAQWSHLTEQTANVLEEMLATRNNKIKR